MAKDKRPQIAWRGLVALWQPDYAWAQLRVGRRFFTLEFKGYRTRGGKV